MDETSRLLKANYTRVAPKILAPVLDVFTYALSIGRGDVIFGIVLLAIVQRTIQDKAFAKFSYADLLRAESNALNRLGTSVRAISSSMGIPRETVRRKVRALEDAGSWFSADWKSTPRH